MSRIAVLGAGITGVTTAYELLERGHDVVVIERHRYPAMATSFANGGQLSASNAEVWNSWATIGKGLRWLLTPGAPLLLNPSPSYHKYSWLAEFCGQIPRHRANTIETTRLAILARQRLFEIADVEQIDFDLERRGILHIYHDRASLDGARAANPLLLAAGLDRREVSPSEMLTIEPALSGRFEGGFFTPSDSTGDIHKFTRGLSAACVRKGGRFLFDADVAGIEPAGQGLRILFVEDADGVARDPVTVDKVVICAGIESRRFAAMLGDRINIYPVKGYSITIGLGDSASQQAAPMVSLLDDAAKIVTSRLGKDRLRVAGTAEFNGANLDIRADRIAPLVRWSQRLFPQIDTSAVIPWAGLRPMTPSMMPRIGRGKRPGVFYNTGHGHLGWTLSAATAQIVAGDVDRELAG